ncbi:MAG: energy transducer TonB [Gemmatimonadota bacterium]
MRKHRPKLRPAAGALPFVLGMAACAPAVSSGPALLPAGWSPPQGQRCEVDDAPRQLPAVDQVVDSAALAGDLAGAGTGGHALFTVGYDTLGVADTVRLAGGDLPAATRAAWLQAVTRRVRGRSPFPVPVRRGRPESWSVLLRVDAGNAPAFRLGRSEHCPPVLTNGFTVQAYAQQTFAELVRNNPGQRRPARVVMDFVVDSTGAVRDARVHTSNGAPSVDEIARRAVSQGRFQPALLNRVPVSSRNRMPFNFTSGTPESQRGRSRP